MSWAFPTSAYKRSDEGHALWWKPGERGRGFVEPSGRVHSWPEEDGSHYEMAPVKGIPWDDVSRSAFLTRTDGTTMFPYLQQERQEREPQLAQILREADPRLKTVKYSPNQGIGQAYGATDAEPWQQNLWYGSDRGLMGQVRTPFWTTSHKPEALNFGGGEGVGVAHPVQVTLRNPAHYFGKRTPGDIEMAREAGNDGIVVHYPEDNRDPSDLYPEREWAIVLDPGAVVPGHDHEWPY